MLTYPAFMWGIGIWTQVLTLATFIFPALCYFEFKSWNTSDLFSTWHQCYLLWDPTLGLLVIFTLTCEMQWLLVTHRNRPAVIDCQSLCWGTKWAYPSPLRECLRADIRTKGRNGMGAGSRGNDLRLDWGLRRNEPWGWGKHRDKFCRNSKQLY